jgi:hypothetical protein
MKQSKSPAARSERFSIDLTPSMARRLRFAAAEDGATPEAFIADAAAEMIFASLDEGLPTADRQPARDEAAKMNSRVALP